MKLTNSQQRKLHRKLRVNASAENVFVKAFMNAVRKEVHKRISRAKTYEEAERIIESIDVKELNKLVRSLSNKVLRKNNQGMENVFKAMTSGMEQISKNKKEQKEFSKALPKLIKNKQIYVPLMQRFEENMRLIKDLPKEIYKELRKGYLQGKAFRGSELEKILYERMGNRAQLIARTESAKVNAALTEVRARSIGVRAYVWSSSEDARVRDTHKVMNKTLVFWDDAPMFFSRTKKGKISSMTGHAGTFPNCRCVQLPVFELDDIKFPIKVAENIKLMNAWVGKNKYQVSVIGGRFVTYTKQQFLQRYGNIFSN